MAYGSNGVMKFNLSLLCLRAKGKGRAELLDQLLRKARTAAAALK